MTTFGLGSAVAGALLAVPLTVAAIAWLPAPRVANHRGVPLPVLLGVPLTVAVAVLTLVLRAPSAARPTPTAVRWTIVAGILVVFAAGVYDDWSDRPGRGLVGHLVRLAHGQITPGVVKLAAAVGAAALVAVVGTFDLPRFLLGIPLIAGSANLWNLLDVRPGRSLKVFLVAAIPLALAYDGFSDPLVSAAVGAALVVLPFDLRERAMLGDAGSNVLGFVLGVGLFRLLPLWAVAVALAAVVALHAVSETVTISWVFRAVPPLRWFDELGRAGSSVPPTPPDG